MSPFHTWKARTLSSTGRVVFAITVSPTNPMNVAWMRAKFPCHCPLLFPIVPAVHPRTTVVIEGQPPLQHRAVVNASESEVIGRNQVPQIIKHGDPAIVVSGSTVSGATVPEVVILKPRVRPINAGNLRTLVHDAKNILGVEEEPVETGGVVAPASRGNQAAALRQRLSGKKRVGWEMEALPHHNLGGTVPAFEEYEVAVVVQT